MGFFDFIKQSLSNANPLQKDSFSLLIEEAHNEYIASNPNMYFWGIKANESPVFKQKILSLSNKEKAAFIVKAVEKIGAFNQNRNTWSNGDKEQQKISVWDSFMRHLCKTKLVLADEDIVAVLNAFMNNKRQTWTESVWYWPTAQLVTVIEKQTKQQPLSEPLKQILSRLEHQIINTKKIYYDQKEKEKLLEKVSALLHTSTHGADVIKPSYLPASDDLAVFINKQIESADEKDRPYWFRLMSLAKKTSGAKPSEKFLSECKAIYEELGLDAFTQMTARWFQFLIDFKEENRQVRDTDIYYQFLAAASLDALKAFVWMCSSINSKEMLSLIASLADRCFKKAPGSGAVAPGLGNACLFTLARSNGMEGIAHLSRLRLRVKQSNTQALIEKYLLEAAAAKGVSIHEIEDLAVSDYGLVNGRREYLFEGYKAVLSVESVGKTSVQWYKPDGTLQKSVPAAVKDKFAADIKQLKATAKDIETTLTAQRDRFDRMLKTGRTMPLQKFQQLYHHHGLLSCLTHNFIWQFQQGESATAGIFINEKWISAEGELPAFGDDTIVSFWHPVFCSTDKVLAWRELLIEHRITQPMKQAFREIYLLTDAELNTRTYSNRMAAHILKQHQFNTLAKMRGWKYSLLGAYDDGRDNEVASVTLPDYNIKAEYWINEVNADDAFNETGIWHYIATDQVRFINLTANEPMELIDVPKLPFSEVMRDVDLFVGVASVGNDPQWRDNGGLIRYQNYWQAYSFGDLTELAKTRKSMLERLLPRLKIAQNATIQDKFLVVKGKLRTYKIHIGSTNILMEPNDQYLCIVPDRGGKTGTENVFLPFEGDSGLSVILSKAILLTDDDKITDPTITRQIKR